MSARRLVLDTNVWIGRLLRPSSIPAQAVAHAIGHDTVLVSEALVAELAGVLARPKFAAYVGQDDARAFLHALGGVTVEVALTAHIEACRDPDDDHILSLAVCGAADTIVTGDADLLALHPFHGIAILTPRLYLDGASGGE
jgi:putative PIN family toxin of toxin-antitoxin system